MRFLAALLLALSLASGARADNLTVQTCGTLPLAYRAGAIVNGTVDVNGNTCISGNITASPASVGTTGAAVPSSADYIAGNAGGTLTGLVLKGSGTNAATTDASLVVAPSPNPSTVCPSVIPVNQTASTDLKTSTNKLHICSIVLVSAAAQNLSLVEGTGSTCATGIAALIGGTTASLAVGANGGFSSVSDRAWLETQTTADHLCLLQSGVGNVSGVITYVDHN